jgi:hypothetical protein
MDCSVKSLLATPSEPSDPADYFRPDVTCTMKFPIPKPIIRPPMPHEYEDTSQYTIDTLEKHQELVKALWPLMERVHWGKDCKPLSWKFSPETTTVDIILEIIALLVEYKKDKPHASFLQAENQCKIGLMASAFLLEALNLPFPAFGVAMSYSKCKVFAVHAKLMVSQSSS